MQLVTANVHMYDAMKDKQIGVPDVVEKWGVGPEKMIDLQAMTGDSTDNVPGIPGIGPKTAALLHQRFKVSSLEELKKSVASGGLDMVDGIGPKTAERIKETLATDWHGRHG